MPFRIPANKPLVLQKLQHATSGKVLGIRFKKGDAVVLPGPRTPKEAAAQQRLRQAAQRSGREMRTLLESK